MSTPEEAQVPIVEKLMVPAKVMMPGPEQILGTFSLMPVSPSHLGPEALLDLLNAPTRMLPFIRWSDGTTLLLRRLAIDWVEVDGGIDPAWVRPRTFLVTREEHVQVRLIDGRLIEGRVSMELPDDMNRVSDFLNLPEEFFPLATRTGSVIVNKARIWGVRLFESSPRPVVAALSHFSE